MIAPILLATPNGLNPLISEANPLPPLEYFAGVDDYFRVKVPETGVSLSVSLVEPDTAPSDRQEPGHAPPNGQPRGTILVLHGIYGRSLWMLGTANMLARAGYRAVLVDLRGHGDSTGKRLTFGVDEAKDLAAVIDALDARGLRAGKVGVYGLSYGATTAIHLAGHDPRIEAVVAVAPFNTMREEVPHFARTFVPGFGWVISDESYQRAIDRAGELGEFDPDRANAVEAIRRTRAQVLIIHGTNDWVVPHERGVQLHEAAPEHSRLLSVPWHGHFTAWLDPTGEVSRHTRAWFDRWLAPDHDAR